MYLPIVCSQSSTISFFTVRSRLILALSFYMTIYIFAVKFVSSYINLNFDYERCRCSIEITIRSTHAADMSNATVSYGTETKHHPRLVSGYQERREDGRRGRRPSVPQTLSTLRHGPSMVLSGRHTVHMPSATGTL